MDHRKAGASTGFGITAPLRAMGVPLNRVIIGRAKGRFRLTTWTLVVGLGYEW